MMSGASIPSPVHCNDACPPRASGVTQRPVRPSNRCGSTGLGTSANTVRLVARYPAAGNVPNVLRMLRRETIRTPPFSPIRKSAALSVEIESGDSLHPFTYGWQASKKACGFTHVMPFRFFRDPVALAEQILHLFNQARSCRLVLDAHRFGQLRHQFALRTIQLSGHLHHNLHDQVAAALLIDIREAPSAHLDLAAALRAFGNLDADRPVDAGNLKLRTHRSLRKADRNYAVQIVAVALEEVVRTH